jgi:hypothetical protein
MKTQSEEEIKWIPANLFFNRMQYPAERYGDYIVAKLSDYVNILIDERSLKALVLTFDRPYIIAENFRKLLARGFIVIVSSRERLTNGSHHQVKYVLNAEDGNLIFVGDILNSYIFAEGKSDYLLVKSDLGYTIFDKNGKQITDWYEDIISYGLARGESDYFIVSKNGKESIFNKDGKQIADWYDDVYSAGLVERQSDYYMVRNNNKDAIFHKSGAQISDWFDKIIYPGGLVQGESDYYIAVKNGKQSIFDKSGKQISDWFDDIGTDGLVKGRSDYFIVNKHGKKAIFYKDGKQITDWYNWIGTNVLDTGVLNYYIARKNNRYAIFDKDGRRISDWYNEYNKIEVAITKSGYFKVKKDNKYAVFRMNDGSQITDWFDDIDLHGLFQGQSDYYIAFIKDKERKTMYIGKLGSSKLYGPLKGFTSWDILGFVSDPSSTSITVDTLDGKVSSISKIEIDQFFEEKEAEDEQTR